MPSQEPINKGLDTLPAVTIYKKITTPFYRSGYEIKISPSLQNGLKIISVINYQ